MVLFQSETSVYQAALHVFHCGSLNMLGIRVSQNLRTLLKKNARGPKKELAINWDQPRIPQQLANRLRKLKMTKHVQMCSRKSNGALLKKTKQNSPSDVDNDVQLYIYIYIELER